MLYVKSVRSPKPIHLVWFTMLALGIGCGGVAQENPYAEPAEPGLPASNMELDFPAWRCSSPIRRSTFSARTA